MNDWMSPSLLWFLVGLVCFLAELVLPGFIIIFFGVGAWVTALLLSLGFIQTFDTQLIIFLVASVFSLILFRRQGKRYFEGKVSGTLPPGADLDDLTGSRALAASDLVPGTIGKVEFRGTIWQADSSAPIPKGSEVVVTGRTNLTLHVAPPQPKGT